MMWVIEDVAVSWRVIRVLALQGFDSKRGKEGLLIGRFSGVGRELRAGMDGSCILDSRIKNLIIFGAFVEVYFVIDVAVESDWYGIS